jgi:DNA-binding NarL/FixJ family response regulator
MGAAPWAERARAELRASGETTPSAESDGTGSPCKSFKSLSSLRVGASNPEIAGQLSLSRRTIEYPLHKVFTKLGLASRAELARAENLA